MLKRPQKTKNPNKHLLSHGSVGQECRWAPLGFAEIRMSASWAPLWRLWGWFCFQTHSGRRQDPVPCGCRTEHLLLCWLLALATLYFPGLCLCSFLCDPFYPQTSNGTLSPHAAFPLSSSAIPFCHQLGKVLSFYGSMYVDQTHLHNLPFLRSTVPYTITWYDMSSHSQVLALGWSVFGLFLEILPTKPTFGCHIRWNEHSLGWCVHFSH